MEALIGTIILCIIGVLLLALVIVLCLPVHVRASYDQGEISAWVRYGPVKFQLFPPARKEQKESSGDAADESVPEKELEKEPEKEPEKKPKKAQKKKKKKPRAKINREQIFYSLEALPPILLRALRRVGRRIRVEPLKLHILVAGADPADTALLYGRLEAVLAGVLPPIHHLLRIEEQDIQLFLDFTSNGMDCIADVGISLRPWDAVSVGIRAGGSLLKWFWRFRRLASPPPVEDEPAEQAAV